MYSNIMIRIVPYALAAGAGFFGAWWVQSVRIDSLKNDHQEYIQNQTELIRKSAAANQRIKEQADHDYQRAKSALQSEIDSGEVYRRCVAAGKCGARIIRVPASSSEAGATETSRRYDAAGTDSVPASSGPAAERIEAPAVVNDCAMTTLMLNRLQSLIESQDGY